MKKRTIIDLFLMFLLLVLLIFLGTRDFTKKEVKDSIKFSKEYSLVKEDNVFVYKDEEEIYDALSKNAIIFMGFKDNEWSNYYAKYLNDVAKENNIKEIYYYDFLTDREKDSVTYEKIIDKIQGFLKRNDLGEINISAPSLLVVKNGSILAYDDETSIVYGNTKPKDYWNEETINNKHEQFNIIFKSYLGGNDGGEN